MGGLVILLLIAWPFLRPLPPVGPLPPLFSTATPLPLPTAAATSAAEPTPEPAVTATAAAVCGAPPAALPRPAGDNRRGVHWCPATRHATAPTERLIAEARALRLQWAVVVIGLDDWNFAETHAREDAQLVQGLRAAGILPIVRLAGQVGADDLPAFQRQVTTLRQLGVQYFQIGNEPNRRAENADGQPDPAAYVRWWLPRAQAVVAAGGYPGLGALDPGAPVGDYAFLRATLGQLRAAEACSVLARTWLATHLYLLGPLDADYLTSENGLGRHRAYDAISRAVLGYSLPQLATEAGISSLRLADWQGDPAGVAQRQAALLAGAYQALPGLPAYFVAFSPWLLANQFCDPGAPPAFEYGVFFDRAGNPQPIVAWVR